MGIKAVVSSVAGLVLLTLASTPAAAQTDMGAYYVACTRDPALAETLQYAFDGMEAGRERFCGCMSDELGKSISQNDAEIYAKFLDGSMTDQDRMNHETFEDLHAFVVETENTCMVLEGFADGYDPGAGGETDTGSNMPPVDTGSNMAVVDTNAYYQACLVADWTDEGIYSMDVQEPVCGCIASTMSGQGGLLQHDYDSLTAWYNGDMSYGDVEASNPGAMAVHDEIVAQCIGPP